MAEFVKQIPLANGMAECDALLSAGTHLLEFTVNNILLDLMPLQPPYFEVVSTLDVDDDGDGFTENQGDCDDNDHSVKPGVMEVENSIDDNYVVPLMKEPMPTMMMEMAFQRMTVTAMIQPLRLRSCSNRDLWKRNRRQLQWFTK